MEFSGRFIPIAGKVGLLSILTSFYATFFSLAAGFIVFLAARNASLPSTVRA